MAGCKGGNVFVRLRFRQLLQNAAQQEENNQASQPS
jgi:hypothetical protein